MVMFIGVAGTHATGKTTCARRLIMELHAVGLSASRVHGVARAAAQVGYPKMDRHNVASTEWIISATTVAALTDGVTNDVVVVDRSWYDAAAYYLAASKRRGVASREADYIRDLARMHARRLSTLIVCEVDEAHSPSSVAGKEAIYYESGFRSLVQDELFGLLGELDVEYVRASSTDLSRIVESITQDALGTALEREAI